MIKLSIFKPEYCLGLYISSHEMVGVLLEQGDASKKPVHRYALSSEQNIFASENTTQLEKMLNEVLGQFSVRYKGEYIPLQVSLADPLVKAAVFDVETVPVQQKARDELIRWRFEKEHHIDMQEMSVTSDAGNDMQARQIYALATRSDLVELVTRACAQHGFVLNALDAAAHFFFNQTNASMQSNASLLQLNNDFWTLLVWGKDKHIRYMRSKWFRSVEEEREHELEEILLDVERLLHSFIESGVAGTTESLLSMLYIEPSAYDRSFLQGVLEQRMENKFMFLDQLDGVESAYKNDDGYDFAAITAVCR